VAKSGDGKSSVMSCAFGPIQEYEREMVQNWRKNVYPKAKARFDLLQVEISELKSLSKAKSRKSDSSARQAAGQGESVGANHSNALMPELSPSMDEALVSRMEALNRQLWEVEREMVAPRMIVDDCTPEKMASLLAVSPVLISASPEARKAIDVLMGHYNSKNNDQAADDVFVKAYSGDPIKVDRQGSGSLDVHNPCLVAFWMVQPGKADRLLSAESLRDSGFLQRCLFGYSEGVAGNFLDSVAIPPDVIREYNTTLRAILDFDASASGPGEVKLTRDAGLMVNDVREAYRQGWAAKGEGNQMFECRYAEQVIRIALNLHIGANPTTWAKHDLGVETVSSAIEVLRFYTQNAEVFTNYHFLQHKLH
jgi:hypothetical protein